MIRIFLLVVVACFSASLCFAQPSYDPTTTAAPVFSFSGDTTQGSLNYYGFPFITTSCSNNGYSQARAAKSTPFTPDVTGIYRVATLVDGAWGVKGTVGVSVYIGTNVDTNSPCNNLLDSTTYPGIYPDYLLNDEIFLLNAGQPYTFVVGGASFFAPMPKGNFTLNVFSSVFYGTVTDGGYKWKPSYINPDAGYCYIHSATPATSVAVKRFRHTGATANYDVLGAMTKPNHQNGVYTFVSVFKGTPNPLVAGTDIVPCNYYPSSSSSSNNCSFIANNLVNSNQRSVVVENVLLENGQTYTIMVGNTEPTDSTQKYSFSVYPTRTRQLGVSRTYRLPSVTNNDPSPEQLLAPPGLGLDLVWPTTIV
eukprot:TRINITY_DN1651_c1_g2_i11.p1 TRINITY_DN1651_c1_g2~~TRINITY_DN1651_c1_g2_i11.p1  ORF type:complete len:365 (-),score=67.43 TRINITY_DN1651_c1_g2_i11:74-1168(-)